MKYGYTCPACGTYVPKGRPFGKICPKCKVQPFPGAGSAPHKCVLFFGEKNAGKLSAILALVKRLENSKENGLHIEVLPSDYPELQSHVDAYPGGKLPAKPAGRKFSSVTLKLTETASDSIQYLTLTCVSHAWLEGEQENLFPRASARVVCWNMGKDWARRQFREEEKMLMWNLGGADGYGAMLKTQLETFIGQICPEEYRRDLSEIPEQDMRNLLSQVRRIQPKNTAPVLLLYNKHDTIDAEAWRIPGNTGTGPVRYLLEQERYACTHKTVSRELSALSPKLIGMLQKTLGDCFYAQLRCAPYGTTVYQNPEVLEEAKCYQKITSAICDFVRLHKYELEYRDPKADQNHKDQSIKQIKSIFEDAKKRKDQAKTSKEQKIADQTWQAAKLIRKRTLHKDVAYTPERMDMLNITLERAERHNRWAKDRVEQIQNSNGGAPNNVDLLETWLLYVIGCKKLDMASVSADGSWTGTYLLTEPACRSVSPKETCRRARRALKAEHLSKWELLRMEAAARCYLFENPDPVSSQCIHASNGVQLRKRLRLARKQKGGRS